jgi:hypothetical protein
MEEIPNGIVGIDMSTPILPCGACGKVLTNLGKLNVQTFGTYYWWECETCDRVWYVRQVTGQALTPMLEWKNHPTINA